MPWRAASTASGVRPDLVGRVAVGGDPVGADEDDVDLAAGHQVAGRDVRDERVRHAGLGELPGGEPGALEVRPGLVDPDVDRRARRGGPPGRPRAPSRTGRRRAARCCSGSGSGAAGPRARAATPRPNVGQPAVVVVASQHDRVGLGAHRGGDRLAVLGQVADRVVAGHQPVDRPAQVDRRRPGVASARSAPPRSVARRAYGCDVAHLLGRQRQPDRGDLADRRRAADDHLADRAGDLAGRSGTRSRRARRAAGAGRSGSRTPSPRGTASGSRRRCRRRRPGRRRPSTPDGVAASSGSRIALAASADARWSAWAAPATVAAVWISSPANWRKKRRRPRSRRRRDVAVGAPAADGADDRARPAGSGRGSTTSGGAGLVAGSSSGSVNRLGLGPSGGQYWMTLVTRRPSSRSRPLRKSSSTRNAEADDLALEPLDQLDRALDRAARREQVVDDQDLLAGLDRVAVDLERVRAVFEGVLDRDRLGRELAQLAHRTRPAPSW